MLGLDQNDMSRKTLDIYKKYFEDRFIQATRQFYSTESETFIAENSVPDYMRKAETRLNVCV
jgi:cullin 1